MMRRDQPVLPIPNIGECIARISFAAVTKGECIGARIYSLVTACSNGAAIDMADRFFL